MTQTFMSLADGFTRRDFTVAEILKLQDLGIISEDDKFELVEGEIAPKPSKPHRHELIKTALILAVVRALPDPLWMGVESSMDLSGADRARARPRGLPARHRARTGQGHRHHPGHRSGADPLGFDLGRKAELHARYGVQEPWVIDAARRRTNVHRRAKDGRWASIELRSEKDSLTHPALPGMSVRLDSV